MPQIPSLTTSRSTSGRRRAAIAIAVALAMLAAPGWAAKVYRCGNMFQDQPCPEQKAPEQRSVERSAATRDAAPCGATKDVSGRSDCIARPSTRDAQTVSVVDAKR